MDITAIAPAGVIALAIAITALLKKFVPKETLTKVIWLPPLIVGIIGAILLGWGKAWNLIAWDALVYAGISSYLVLVKRRTIK
jgi:hypothetical protein